MRIKSIHPISSVIVRTTEKPWGEYQRYSADNWQLLMGMSWEEVDGTELEKLYQEYIAVPHW
jgi:hypothetical protein